MTRNKPVTQFKRVYVEISNICNLKCEFCSELKREKKIMSLDEFRNIITQIKPHTNFIYLHVKGEPLMHPNLEQFLQLCYDQEMQVNITTNATLLKKQADMLCNSPALRQVNISVHSFSAHDGIDIANYIDSIINFAKRCDALGKYIVLRFWNLDNQRNVDKTSKSIMHEFEKAYDLDFALVDKMNTTKSVQIRKNTFVGWEQEFVWPSIENEYVSDQGYCYGMRHQVAILVDGSVVPCCLDANGECILGNVFTERFSEIISSNTAKKIRHGFEQNYVHATLCKHCSFRSRFDKYVKKTKDTTAN